MPITLMTGPDVSHHQGHIDFRAVRGAGHKVAILKATEGRTFKDSRFDTNLSNARAAGLGIGAYHFLRAGNGSDQAEWFHRVTGGCPGMVPILDCETGHDGTNPSFADVKSFIDRFGALTGGRPVVLYTYNAWWEANCGAQPIPAKWLWIARYRRKALSYGDTPTGQYQMFGWQYTSTGRCPGVDGDCDLNDIYISAAQWGTLAAQHFNEPEDDHMSAADVDALEYKVNRMFHWLVTGKENSVVSPANDPDWAWVREQEGAITTLNEIPEEGQIALYASRGFANALLDEGETGDAVRAKLKDLMREVLSEHTATEG